MTALLSDAVRLEDPDFYVTDPYPVYAELRRHAPVYRYEHDEVGFWALSKFDDVKAASTNPAFSVRGGVLASDPRFRKERGRILSAASNPEGSVSMLGLDPPEHSKIRRLAVKAFTPRVVASLEDATRRIVREALDTVNAGEPFDFVPTLAAPLPMYVIADLLGVPRSDRDAFQRWADNSITSSGRISKEQIQRMIEVEHEMWSYLEEKLTERERNPGSDFMSSLVTAEVDGEGLSRPNQVSMCSTLLAAGNETTRSLLSGAVHALVEHPDQFALLRERRELVPTAVDEMLRWVTPVATFARSAREATEIRGQEIAKGDYVLLLYGSANRDEDHWPDGDVFDVSREVDPMHVAFGWGPHLCLGGSLARMEIRVFFDELLERFETVEAAGAPVKKPSTLINSFASLPVLMR